MTEWYSQGTGTLFKKKHLVGHQAQLMCWISAVLEFYTQRQVRSRWSLNAHVEQLAQENVGPFRYQQ